MNHQAFKRSISLKLKGWVYSGAMLTLQQIPTNVPNLLGKSKMCIINTLFLIINEESSLISFGVKSYKCRESKHLLFWWIFFFFEYVWNDVFRSFKHMWIKINVLSTIHILFISICFLLNLSSVLDANWSFVSRRAKMPR